MNTFNTESIKSIAPLFVSSKGGSLKVFATEADQIVEILVDNNEIYFNLDSLTEISLNLPALPKGAKKIVFKTQNDTIEKENAFFVISPLTITQIRNLNSGSKKVVLSRDEKIQIPKTGGSFRVFGSGFEFINSIKIDKVEISNFEIISDNELVLNTPSINSGKKNSLYVKNIVGDDYVFEIDIDIKNQPPSILSVSPNSKNINSFATITITGSNFDSDFLEVKVNEDVQNIQFSSFNNIIFQYNGNIPGPKDVSVKTNAGTAISKNAFLNFSSPRITNVSPRNVSQAGGTPVSVTGANLNLFNSVSLGEINCQITQVTQSSLTFICPAFTIPGYKTLVLSGSLETISEFNIIEVIAEPSISSIFPSTLNPNAIETVTIFGENLLNLTNLQAGSNSSQLIEFTPYNNFSGEATIYPNFSGSGIQTIQTQSIMGESSELQSAYAYVPQNPVVERVFPSSSPSNNISINTFGESYKTNIYGSIYGRNFLPAPSVSIGGQNIQVLSTTSYGSFNDVINVFYPTEITGYADVVVSTMGRTGILKSGINFINKPFVEKMYPSYSWSGGGQLITIEGKNLSGCNVFIEQGKFTNQTFVPAAEVKVHSDSKISFFTIPGSGGCQGEYQGSCLDPKGNDGPRFIKISGPGGDIFYSGLNYLNEPKITSIYQTGFDINYGQLPSDTLILSGNINNPNDPNTWNSFDGTPVKFFPGDQGSFFNPVSVKLNGVELEILETGSSASGLVCKIPYPSYSLSGSNKTLLSVSEVYETYYQTGYSGDYVYDFEGEMAYIDNLYFEKVNFMSGVARILQTGLSGTFSTPSANQSFNQKISTVLSSFASPANFFGNFNFNSITGDTDFRAIVNSGLVRFLPLFRWASGIHFTGTSNGTFTGNNQDFYDPEYPWYFIYSTGDFSRFESGNITEIVTSGTRFSGYLESTVSSGLSARMLKDSLFIDSRDSFNQNSVFVDKYLGYKIWYHNGISQKDHSLDDWYEANFSVGRLPNGNPATYPTEEELKKLEPIKFCKKSKINVSNGFIPDTKLSLNLPDESKIGSIVRIDPFISCGTGCNISINYSNKWITSDGGNIESGQLVFSGNGTYAPITFLKTRNGWNIIHRGNYSLFNSALNTGVAAGWIMSPETGELNFSFIKRSDNFNNGYFGNYIPNRFSNNSSGTLYIDNHFEEERHNGLFNSTVTLVESGNRVLITPPPFPWIHTPTFTKVTNESSTFSLGNLLQVESIEGIKNESSVSAMPFVPPYIDAIKTRTTGSNNASSPNYGPLEFDTEASGIYNGGYKIDLSGYFQKSAGVSEVFIGQQKVAQFNSASFGGTPPFGANSQSLLSIDVTGFSFEELGTFDVTIKNSIGESTLPNAFTVFEIPQRGSTVIQSTSAPIAAPTPQNPAIYPRTIDLNQDNIPDSWDNQYFPNALNFDTFRITGFSNPLGFSTGRSNSPNSIYFKNPVKEELDGVYYYESGTQNNAKGPNFIYCSQGTCKLFLAPKNTTPSGPYDPINGAWAGSEIYLVSFGASPTPIPWNRNWKYEESINYAAGNETGTVSPIFINPINHHIFDSDGDGQKNANEFVFGTNPTTGTSRYSPSYSISGGFFNFFVPTIQNRRYIIQTGNLINWFNAAVITGDGFTKQFSTPAVGGSIFFRSSVEVLHKPSVINFIHPSRVSLTGNINVGLFGSSFSTVKAIAVDNVSVSNFEILSDSSIVFKAPAISTTGAKNISITNHSGTTIRPGIITYNSAPIINSISPNKFPLGGGSATVRGSGFNSPVSAVIENEDTLTVSSLTPTGFNILIPTQFRTGIKNVIVTAADSSSYPIEIHGAPNITSIVPNRGSVNGGTQVTINGTNFISGYTKLFIETSNPGNFQEIPISGFSGTSSIFAVTPASATTPPLNTGCRNLKIETFGGANSASLNKGYCYVNSPTISSINPSTGNINGFQNIIVSGSNFTSDTNIFIDGFQILNKTFISASSISGRTPTGTSIGFKNVIASGSQQGTSTLVSGYRYANSPIINLVSPSCIRTGTTPTILIAGSGLLLSPRTIVTIGGIASTAISNFSETGLTVNAPLFSNGGPAIAFVDTDAGRSNTLGLSYLSRPSDLLLNSTSSPLTGRLNLTLYGNHFGAATCPPSLKIGGNSTNIKSFTSSEIVFDAPTGSAGLKNVEISNIGGTGVINNGFMYLMPPTILRITPSQGLPLGGNLIEISGSGLSHAQYGGGISTKVFLNDSETSILNLNGEPNGPSFFRVTAPAQTNRNTIDIRFENAGGTTTVLNAYSYTSSMAINSFLPSGGPLAGGNTFIASGSNIPSDVIVRFGNTAATNVTVISNTGIRGVVPSTSSIGSSTVTITGGGMPAITRNYVYLGQPIITSINPSVGPSDFNNIPLTLSGSRFTLPGSNVNYNSTLKIGSNTAQIVSISETSVTANLNEFVTPTGAKNVTFSNLGGTGTLTNGYTGVTYMPTYAMPPYTGNSQLFTSSATVNTLYVSYQP